LAHSWEWMYTSQKNPPYILQLDCETDGGSKLMQLGKFGFHFVDSNGTCDHEKYILWTPYIGPFLKPYLPLVGYILMITV
uniref:CUB domain-containing protein n=1 Tax=Angiostrongylus cantonensis TaxID=6313 RepID=A0A0K0D559_ANGCA